MSPFSAPLGNLPASDPMQTLQKTRRACAQGTCLAAGEPQRAGPGLQLAFHFAGCCHGVGDAAGLVNAERDVASPAICARHVTDLLPVGQPTKPDRHGVQGQGVFSVPGRIGPAQVDLAGLSPRRSGTAGT